MMGRKLWWTPLLLSIATGCESEGDRRRAREIEQQQLQQAAVLTAREQERIRLEEEKARIEAEKKRVLSDPNAFLEYDDPVFYDKGIINDYRQLRKISVMNKSKFNLGHLSGEIDWIVDDAKLGTIPFTLKGSIRAGDTKIFSTDDGTLINGTIQGSANRVRLRFTKVQILDAQ